MDLKPGTKFDTAYEQGCIVVESPSESISFTQTRQYRTFLAKAPDGVICEYITAMVKGHPDYDPK